MRKKDFWTQPFLRSCVRSDKVHWPELLLGYFLGPFGVLLFNAVLVGYSNVYFTDVLGISGPFLVIFPMVSSVLAVVMNLAMGVVVDRTHTAAGKARPYLLLSAPVLLVAGILLYTLPATVPNGVMQMVWIVVAYNLYLSIGNTIFSMGNSLMVPLSTRDGSQRSRLSVFNNISQSASVGLISIVFPMILAVIGTSKQKWTQVMCLFAAIACCSAILEYYFTRERITEETMDMPRPEKQNVPVAKQLKAILTEPYWWIIVLFYILWQFSGTMKNGSMTYFCNYIAGSYSDGITQTILAIIGAIPLALGVLIAWPLANKLGKRNFAVIGLLIGAVGGVIMWMAPRNLTAVSTGLFVKSIGMIPGMTIMMALFSDVLDHMEWKNGFRCDGLSMSIYSACMTTLSGLCSGIMNAMLSGTGYTAPDTVETLLPVQKILEGSVIYCQPAQTETVMICCYILFELVAWVAAAVLLLGLNVEKNLPAEQAQIQARRQSR